MIKQIIQFYNVDMSEAKEQNFDKFSSFNAFFTRELKPGARPIASSTNTVVCPADGVISQAGLIDQGKIFQAKGKYFSTVELLGGKKETAEAFENGSFATIYLSPRDYHRLHMPVKGELTEMLHVPGRLFSVNTATTNSVSRLFARNERVVCLFDTEYGPMALILVGAIFVSSIETTWHGVVTPPSIDSVRRWEYKKNPHVIEKGEEMGRFNMGSTIIVLFGKDKVAWDSEFQEGKKVRLGEKMGKA